jgi:surfactin synthase thioesterase subunit
MTMALPAERDAWIKPIRTSNDPLATVFCFPHAGGGPSAFRNWARASARGLDVVALALPGREERFSEPSHVDVVQLADAVARHARGPFGLFGHSMGAFVAFAVQHILLARGVPGAQHVWVSAAGSPAQRDDSLIGAGHLPDAELMRLLVGLGGVPLVVAADPDSAALFLPPLRADLNWLDDYLGAAPAPLPTPVSAVVGRDDALVNSAQAGDWARFTRAAFQMNTIEGGHFAAYDQTDTVCGAIQRSLLRADAGSEPSQTVLHDAGQPVGSEQGRRSE